MWAQILSAHVAHVLWFKVIWTRQVQHWDKSPEYCLLSETSSYWGCNKYRSGLIQRLSCKLLNTAHSRLVRSVKAQHYKYSQQHRTITEGAWTTSCLLTGTRDQMSSRTTLTSSVRVVRICDSQWLKCQIRQLQNELTLPALIKYRLQDNDVVVEHLDHWEPHERQTVRNNSLNSSVSNFPSDQTTRLQEHRPHTSGQTASNKITGTMRWEEASCWSSGVHKSELCINIYWSFQMKGSTSVHFHIWDITQFCLCKHLILHVVNVSHEAAQTGNISRTWTLWTCWI